jgi:sulfide:quinone oxidoreductase
MRRRAAKGTVSVGDHWSVRRARQDIDIEFYNAGGVLFGVKDYVPALMEYVERTTPPELHAQSGRIDGPAKRPGSTKTPPTATRKIDREPFDMIHVVPAADRARLHPGQPACRCRRLGRCRSGHAAPQDLRQHLVARRRDERPNAKTAAAARKQAPVVANNVLADMGRPRASRGTMTATAPAR